MSDVVQLIRRVGVGGQRERGFGNYYFKFHVQILLSSIGLKNGAHNICPLRNQFQMLFVTNRGIGS